MKKKHLTLTIDCAKARTPLAIHRIIAKSLHFPAHYGHNLDALSDSLSDVLIEHDIELSWKDSPHSRKDNRLQTLKDTLTKRIENNT